MTEVERLTKVAMTAFAGNAHRGVVAGMALDGDYAVIVVGPRDDLAIVSPSEGPSVTGADGKVGPEKPAKVKAGKVKGDVGKLAHDAAKACIGAAMASTGLAE